MQAVLFDFLFLTNQLTMVFVWFPISSYLLYWGHACTLEKKKDIFWTILSLSMSCNPLTLFQGYVKYIS